MKAAICFFGEIAFMDRFMIQNYIRCVLTPLKKHNKSVHFYFFLHTYMGVSVLSFIETMRTFFPFQFVSIHDKEMVLCDTPMGVEPELYLEDYSLHLVKKMWNSSSIQFDMVVYTRADVLFSRPLSIHDAVSVVNDKNRLFVAPNTSGCLVMCDTFVANVYGDRMHYLSDLESGSTSSFLEHVCSHYDIQVSTLSIVFVRILADGVVHPDDCNVCPYLKDLITSSSSRVRITRRKNSFK